MNDYRMSFRECRMIERAARRAARRAQLRRVLIVALVALVCALTLALWEFWPRLAFGATRNNYTTHLPMVTSGITVTLASGTGVIVPTPQGN